MSTDATLLDEDRNLQAALVWDVPRLRRSGAAGADDFIDAFGPNPREATAPVAANASVLELAAAGVLADRRGQGYAALEFYDQIRGGFWADLLRHSLRAWSTHVAGVDDIQLAGELVRQLPERVPPRAMLAAKLATFAYDKGDRPLVERWLRDALATSPDHSRLRFLLALEVLNILGEPVAEVPRRLTDVPPDPLADRDWIDSWALTSSQTFLAQALTDQARDPWSQSIRIGTTPLDQILAAEIQVTWAGGLWRRRTIRKQLGAQLLLAHPQTASQVGEGLFFWFSSGGRDYRNVTELVEPALDQAACDWLMHALASRVGPEEGVTNTLANVAAQLWDCISDSLIRPLLISLPIAAGEHPLVSDSRRVWVRLAERAPNEISARMSTLPEDTQAALVDELDYSALRELDELQRDSIVELLHQRTSLTQGQWLSLSALERTAAPETRLSPFSLGGVPSGVVVLLAQLDSDRVANTDLRRALEDLAHDVREQRLKANEGTIGLGGGPSSARLLADGLIAYGEVPDIAIPDALWESALDEALAGELRLQSLGALARLSAGGLLVPDHRDRLRASATRDDDLGLLTVSGDLLRAARLLVLAHDLRPREEVELLALGRSKDVRAREIAINAAGLALAAREGDAGGSALVEQIVLTALFDPTENVIVRGLDVVAAGHVTIARGDETLGRRLVELIQTRRRAARAASARTALALQAHQRVPAATAVVLGLAEHDKSWRVRQAAIPD